MSGTSDAVDSHAGDLPMMELAVDDSSMRVSRYDRASSALIISLVAVGSSVALLFLVWLTRQILTSKEAVPVEYIEALGEGDDAAGGSSDELMEPGMDEIAEIEPELDETLSAVTDAISSKAAALDALFGDSLSAAGAKGDGREARTGGEGAIVIPRWQRWQIDFESADLPTYAKQLDGFGIELAACGGGSESIEYATHLRKPAPDKRTGAATDEDRLYMTWRHGGLRRADIALLARAGVQTAGKLVVQFYPPAVEQQLAAAEMQKAGSRTIEEIRKTVFGITGGGGNYSFYVKEQQYR